MNIICAGNIESFDFATPIGIGLIESTMTLVKFIVEQKPKALLFIGSAGSYGRYQPLDIVCSHQATNIETGYFSKSCYTPLISRISSKILNVSCETTNVDPVVINSSNYITTNKHISKEYLNLGLEAENMEFFSVLTVANQFNLPAFGIFVITNYCDDDAHKNFLKNHEKAKEILTKKTKEIMSTYGQN